MVDWTNYCSGHPLCNTIILKRHFNLVEIAFKSLSRLNTHPTRPASDIQQFVTSTKTKAWAMAIDET